MSSSQVTYIKDEAQVPEDMAGKRLDQVVAQLFSDHSRSRLQRWIKSGELTVDGAQRRIRDSMLGGEQLVLDAKVEAVSDDQPEAIDLDIVFQSLSKVIISKEDWETVQKDFYEKRCQEI